MTATFGDTFEPRSDSTSPDTLAQFASGFLSFPFFLVLSNVVRGPRSSLRTRQLRVGARCACEALGASVRNNGYGLYDDRETGLVWEGTRTRPDEKRTGIERGPRGLGDVLRAVGTIYPVQMPNDSTLLLPSALFASFASFASLITSPALES